MFRNDIKHYVFRNPLSEEEFHDREEEFAERFGAEEPEGEEHDHGEFPFVEFVGRDSTIAGFEAHGDVKLGGGLTLEATFDLVRGELSDTGDPRERRQHALPQPPQLPEGSAARAGPLLQAGLHAGLLAARLLEADAADRFGLHLVAEAGDQGSALRDRRLDAR